MKSSVSLDKAHFEQLDKTDPLPSKRDAFNLPQDKIYLDGNSLGAQPKQALTRAIQVIERQWGEDLISSWNSHQWIDLPSKVGEKIARLIGAASGQVVCCDSISVNLFKLLSAALSIASPRKIILSTSTNFPTDLYIAQGVEEQLGQSACQLKTVEPESLFDNLTEDVAVLMLTQVDFRTGYIFDMQQITQAAHEKGILVLWDLAHSAGAIEVELDRCNVDFALGCGYKYLNGGPGAPAFLYINRRHQEQFVQPLYGWMGHASPFAFEQKYTPSKGIEQALVGTPSIIAMSTLDAALDVFDDVDMSMLRTKSVGLSTSFLDLMDQHSLLATLQMISPSDEALRGSQLAFAHSNAYAICQALIARGVIADFRAPNILRFGFAPLYNSYQDIFQAVIILNQIISSEDYLQPRFQVRAKVT